MHPLAVDSESMLFFPVAAAEVLLPVAANETGVLVDLPHRDHHESTDCEKIAKPAPPVGESQDVELSAPKKAIMPAKEPESSPHAPTLAPDPVPLSVKRSAGHPEREAKAFSPEADVGPSSKSVSLPLRDSVLMEERQC